MIGIGIFVFAFGLTVPVLAATAEKLEVTLSRVTRVAGQASGNYNFFRVSAAPDDANRAMVCTLHWDPSANEGSAELLTSSDAGETWKLRVEDKSSHAVSEDACAFGERGLAYFIAQPWNIRNPHAYGADLDMSDMHFYRSTTYGETWPAHLTSTFIDYARIIVDTQPGSPFRGRAYIAGHRTAAEMFPLIAVLEAGKQLVPAKQSKRLQDSPLGNWPCYPRSLVVLQNGDVLASYTYWNAQEHRGSAVITVSRDGGKTVEGPFTIDADIQGVDDASIDQEPRGGGVYAFYCLKKDDACAPTIASSEDGGRTWRRVSIPLENVMEPSRHKALSARSITFRNDGTALLTWTADSVIHGAVFYPGWQLLWTGQLAPNTRSAGVNPFSDYSFPYVRPDFRFAEHGSQDSNADMNIRLQFYFTNFSEHDVARMTDGSFLIVWAGNDGQLYSRSLRLTVPPTPVHLDAEPTKDVTQLVRYEARNINYDENVRIFEYEVDLVNVSNERLRGPFVMKIKKIDSTIGPAILKDSFTDRLIFTADRSGILLPGDHTAAVRVRIQVSPNVRDQSGVAPSRLLPGIGLIGRVYAQSVE